MLILPDQKWKKPDKDLDKPVVPRDTLNESATPASKQQLSVAAENAPLRVLYGTTTIGPQIACVLSYQGNLVILAVWGHGEVDGIVQIYLDDKPVTLTEEADPYVPESPPIIPDPDPPPVDIFVVPPVTVYKAVNTTTITACHYVGTANQTVNPTLVSAFAAQSPAQVYTDALAGVCYSVFTVPRNASSGFPRLTAKIKGRKVWTGSENVWSDNPAYCLADFCTNTVYGMGKSVDWASVTSVAEDCDALVGTEPNQEKRRQLDLCMETVQPVQSWLDTLRSYAGCWVTPSASGLRFVSDKPGSVVASFDHASGQIQSISQLKKRGTQNMPTVMTVTYRDVTTTPARDAPAVVYAYGVLAGVTPRRESQVSLPGITRYSQAIREATERLNKLLQNDLSCTLSVFDEALVVDVGDIVTVTHPIGLSAKPLRVKSISGEYGRYTLGLEEYDPAVYSDTVATAPTIADTNLPNPAAPPEVSGVVMTEEVFAQQNGTYSSRWRVTWGAASYSFLAHYRAELWIGSTLIFAGSPSGALWVTPSIQEGQTYTVKVAAVSSIGSTGVWATQSGTALGKQLTPSNVPGITAFEAGGRVYVSWQAAVDIDIWRYEVRYGTVGAAWSATNLIDRVDALRLQTEQIPVGTWTLHVKCVDSVGNYSDVAATCNVVVTSDASAFLVSSYDQTSPMLTAMQEYSLHPTDTNRYFVSEDDVMFGTKFSENLSTYTDPMATFHASQTSTWLGEAEDYGLDLGGQWTGTATVTDVNGTHQSYFGSAMSATPSEWSYAAGMSQKLNARFARLKHECLTTSTMLVTIPEQSIRLDAVPREEVGTGTSSASGPITVTLSNVYVAVKKLTITPQGTTARSATYDNIVLGPSSTTFDVYVFNDAGSKIASDFRFEWQGV